MITDKKYKVIVYGISGMLKRSYKYIQTRFDVVGYSDKNSEKAETLNAGEQYIYPDKIRDYDKEYDYIIISSIFDDEIKEFLVKEQGIEENKVLKLEQWQSIAYKTSFGEKNPDKTFYVMSRFTRDKDGLFSYIYCFLEQLEYVDNMGYIPVVDMMNYKNQYLEEDKFCKENSWEYYFEQLSDYSLEEVYESKNVILGYDKGLYFDDLDSINFTKYMELWNKYFRLNKNAFNYVTEQKKKLFNDKDRILGVLYRGTDYKQLKLKRHAKQPDINELMTAIDNELKNGNYNKIFLSTEDYNMLKQFIPIYGDKVVFTNQKRFTETGSEWLADISNNRENDKYLRGMEYLATIMLLAECNSMIVGICCGSVCAKIINNNKFEMCKLMDRGFY